jgi:hypothetical protein
MRLSLENSQLKERGKIFFYVNFDPGARIRIHTTFCLNSYHIFELLGFVEVLTTSYIKYDLTLNQIASKFAQR